jgi:hypothetical protein
MEELSRDQIISLYAKAERNFRPFTKYDWMAFSGCESDTPAIAEVEGYTLVLDGNTLEYISDDADVHGVLDLENDPYFWS